MVHRHACRQNTHVQKTKPNQKKTKIPANVKSRNTDEAHSCSEKGEAALCWRWEEGLPGSDISTNEKGSTENSREKSHSSNKLQRFPGLDNGTELENTNALGSSSRE